jgi:hypothetical protein
VGVQKSPHCTKHNAHTREFGYSTEMRKRVKVTLQGRKQCSGTKRPPINIGHSEHYAKDTLSKTVAYKVAKKN